jgi:hypothetical protein
MALHDTVGKRATHGGLRISRASMQRMAAFVVGCALAWFFANVWTAPTGIGWHAVHGSDVAFQGQKIPVPWDMWVSNSDDEGLAITREAARDPLFRSASGLILISRTKAGGTNLDMAKNYDRLTRENQDSPTGFIYKGVRELSAANGKGYCWESVSVDAQYDSISCLFDKDTLAASFVGSPGYRDKFYRIVDEISGAPSTP